MLGVTGMSVLCYVLHLFYGLESVLWSCVHSMVSCNVFCGLTLLNERSGLMVWYRVSEQDLWSYFMCLLVLHGGVFHGLLRELSRADMVKKIMAVVGIIMGGRVESNE